MGLEKYDKIEPLTIEEYTNLREAMFAVRETTCPSASFQAKPFFNDQENFDVVMGKLELLMLYGSEKRFI